MRATDNSMLCSQALSAGHEHFGIFEDDLIQSSSIMDSQQHIHAALYNLPSSADLLYFELCFETCDQVSLSIYALLCDLWYLCDHSCPHALLARISSVRSTPPAGETPRAYLCALQCLALKHGVPHCQRRDTIHCKRSQKTPPGTLPAHRQPEQTHSLGTHLSWD